MNKLFRYAAVLLLYLNPNVHFGQAPNLGSSANFALFTAAGAFNSNAATIVTGDVGTNVGAYVAPTLIPPSQSFVANAVSAQAATDVMLAYAQVFGLPCGTVLGVGLGGGQLLMPPVVPPAMPSTHNYCIGAASTLSGDLILDGGGDPNALFIFKINGAFASAVNSRVILQNGAMACNVYWQINGAVSLETGTQFKGTILANGAISLLGNATLEGRALSTAGAIATAMNVVTLNPVRSVIATTVVGASTTFCAGGSVSLSGNTNGGTWCNGANPTATPSASSITVTTSGDYFVKNMSCGRTVMSNHIIVTVNPLPLAIVGPPVAICLGNSVQLGTTDISGHTYAWTTTGVSGDLSATNIANPIATPTAVGATIYTLTETITATGCQMTNSVTITVTMGATGNCIITGSNMICPPTTNQLCVPFVTGASYSWSAGGGGVIVGVANTNCITISAAGDYTVVVTLAGGCVSTCTQTVTVVSLVTPIITAGGPTTFCAGGSVVLSGNTSGGMWTTTSATPILTPFATSITVSTSGTYRLTNSNICGSRFADIVVTVNPLPNCTITGNGFVCAGGMTTLCAPSGLIYSWNTMPPVSTSCIITETAGIYTVTVTDANGCQNRCSKAVIVNPLPNPQAGGALTICRGAAVQLGTAPIAGHTYIWTPALGLSNPNIANPFALPSVITTYTLTETITATGCQKSDAVVVASYPMCECACR
jgi:hypothetical protein